MGQLGLISGKISLKRPPTNLPFWFSSTTLWANLSKFLCQISSERVLVKPDAFCELVGEIPRFERKLKMIAMKLAHLDEATLTEHYEILRTSHFPSLVQYMRSTPVVAVVYEGVEIIDEVRKVVGATNPQG